MFIPIGSRRLAWCGMLLLSMALAALPDGSPAASAPRALPLALALKKARVNGKYEMLLRQIEVRKDGETHKGFRDFGLRDVKEYAGHTDLPRG